MLSFFFDDLLLSMIPDDFRKSPLDNTEKNQIYKCEVCGNILEVLHGGKRPLKCCGTTAWRLTANTVDTAKEKHVPVVEKTSAGLKVKVGRVDHPMEEKHYIEWVEIIADESVFRRHLKPGDVPEVTFDINPDQATARAYCNLHGLWEG
jgi:superoxide reductase